MRGKTVPHELARNRDGDKAKAVAGEALSCERVARKTGYRDKSAYTRTILRDYLDARICETAEPVAFFFLYARNLRFIISFVRATHQNFLTFDNLYMYLRCLSKQ